MLVTFRPYLRICPVIRCLEYDEESSCITVLETLFMCLIYQYCSECLAAFLSEIFSWLVMLSEDGQ